MTRFFIALLPPQEIQDYATGVIQELGDRFHTYTAKAPPHVTLQPPFEWSLDRLPELEACLVKFATQHPQISVELSGFGAFPPRVLYIDVLKTSPLLSLQATLMQTLEQSLEIGDAQSKQRPFAPHLTVASRNITRQSFRQAWELLQARPIEFVFKSDRLTLLLHDGQRWVIQQEFFLLGD